MVKYKFTLLTNILFSNPNTNTNKNKRYKYTYQYKMKPSRWALVGLAKSRDRHRTEWIVNIYSVEANST